MNWIKHYPQTKEPTMDDIAGYIKGNAHDLWQELTNYLDTAYRSKPKITFSGCSLKPGWNVKYKKSSQSFGTLYPEENSFSVFIVISYKLNDKMESILHTLSPQMADMYMHADDYMKMGVWMMFDIDSKERLEDYKKLLAVKLEPKYL